MQLIADERYLLAKAQAHEPAAFTALIQGYALPVYRLAYRMLGNHEDAEDVQQETFIHAYHHLAAFRGEAAFGTWLYAIAARQCLNWRRRRACRPSTSAVDVERACSNRYWDDPEQQCLLDEEAERVQRVLAVMAPADRLLIILKYLEGLQHEEIARVLHCSVESSRTRLTRAKKLFRARYEEAERSHG